MSMLVNDLQEFLIYIYPKLVPVLGTLIRMSAVKHRLMTLLYSLQHLTTRSKKVSRKHSTELVKCYQISLRNSLWHRNKSWPDNEKNW